MLRYTIIAPVQHVARMSYPGSTPVVEIHRFVEIARPVEMQLNLASRTGPSAPSRSDPRTQRRLSRLRLAGSGVAIAGQLGEASDRPRRLSPAGFVDPMADHPLAPPGAHR